MQTAQLGVVHHRYLVGGVARLHTDLQRRMISTGCIRHICIAIQHTNAVPLARTIGRAIYDNLRIGNVQCAGHIGRFLPHANIARIQRSCTLDRQVIRGHFADCIDRIFRNIQHHFDRAVFNSNAAIHSHIVCNDVERLRNFFREVTAPDADFLIRFTRKYVGHIPLEKTDFLIVYFVIGTCVRVTPPHVDVDGRRHVVCERRHGRKAEHHAERHQDAQQILFHDFLLHFYFCRPNRYQIELFAF